MKRIIVLTITIYIILAVPTYAARNPMAYWYEWKEEAEISPYIVEIKLGWEDNTYWRIDIIYSSERLEKENILLISTQITKELCKKAVFPMFLVISTDNDPECWRGIYMIGDEKFTVDRSGGRSNRGLFVESHNKDEISFSWMP